MDLVVGRDLDQLDHALAPVAQGLDPGRRAAVVADAVQIVVEHAVALDQAEALGGLVEVAGVEDPGRVVERAPDPLAGPVPDREPVGIVDLGPPVGDLLAAIFGVPEHRGQRRDAQPLDVLAQEQVVLDVHDHAAWSR